MLRENAWLPLLLIAMASLGGCGASLNEGVVGDLSPQTSVAGPMPAGTPVAAVAQSDAPAAPKVAAAPAAPKAAAQSTALEGAGASSLSATPSSTASLQPASAATGSVKLPDDARKAVEMVTASTTPGSTAYKIGPLDVLEISVFKVPDLSRSVQVADTGTINLPLLGEVPAGGKTSRELEQYLAKQLGAKYLQSPQVTVYVKEYNSRRVTIEGSVRKPGVFPISQRTTLLQFVAMAGGPTEAADTADVLVFRGTSTKRSAARFDLDDIRNGGSEDPVIEQGDVIVVNQSMAKTAFGYVMQVLPVGRLFVPLF